MPSTNYFIDDKGELYRELDATTVLKLSDGTVLLKFTITTLEPVTGNPIGPGWLMFVTYS